MKKSIWGNILYVLLKTWKYEKRVVFVIILQTIAGVVIPVIGVLLPALVVNGISNGLGYTAIISMVMVILLLLVINTVMTYISNIYGTYLLNNKIGFLSALFRKKMRMDYAYIESPEGQKKYENALFSILNDFSGVPGMLSLLGPMFGNVLGIIANIILIIKFNIGIAAVLVVTSGVHVMVACRIRARQDMLRDTIADTSRKLNYLFNYVSGCTSVREIKIFGMHAWMQNAINRVVQIRMGIAKKSAKYNSWLYISDSVMLAFRDIFAYIVTIQSVFSGQIEVWELVFYLGAISCISSFFAGLTNNIASMGQRNLEIITLREFMERDFSDSGMELTTDRPIEVELKDVSFRFSEGEPHILRHINLVLHPDEKIAIVGENGAGKSTLVKIICGLYKPTEGKVLVNGIELEKIKLSSYQKLLATAFQDTYLMPMSVGENVAFGAADSSTAEVKECLKIAGLDEEFPDEKKSLTKMLDSGGLVPSGGQKQKLILARVAFKLIYRGAQVLILDEPTSAMDAISEKMFYEKYIGLSKDKGCILISHRMKSTCFCDSIVVMENGKIIETGTHDGLMDKGGRYRAMYELQSSYYQ